MVTSLNSRRKRKAHGNGSPGDHVLKHGGQTKKIPILAGGGRLSTASAKRTPMRSNWRKSGSMASCGEQTATEAAIRFRNVLRKPTEAVFVRRLAVDLSTSFLKG